MNKQIVGRKYPSDWDIMPLAEFAKDGSSNFVDGPFGSDLKVSDYTKSGIRVLQLQNLGDGIFIDTNKIYTSEKKARQLIRCLTYPGDIIIAKMAEPLARAALVPDIETQYIIVADLIKLRLADEVIPYYVLCFINFSDFRKEAERLSTGTTRTRISLSTLKKISLPKPPRKIQHKLAGIFRLTDLAIEKTEALIHKYQQIKAGLMHDLFTRGVTADGKLRPPREQAPELYQETPIGWIPKEWGVAYLDDEIRIIDCKHYTPTYREEGYPVVRPRNVHDDGLDFSDIDFVSRKDFLSLTDTHKPSISDIVFSRNASFGIPCYVEDDLEFAIGQDVVIMVEKLANTKFVYYTLKSNIVIKQISRLFSGSTFGRINLGDIRKLKIPTPRYEEQERIAFRLMVNDNRINQEKRNKSKLTKLKSGLMHDLLTGKIPVTIDQEETAHGS